MLCGNTPEYTPAENVLSQKMARAGRIPLPCHRTLLRGAGYTCLRMAWRFRKSIKLGPLRLNLSKSGIGTSIGVRGFRVGTDAKGRSYTAASIPGTGLYSRTYSSQGKAASGDAAPGSGAPPQSNTGNGAALVVALIAGGLLVLFLTTLFSSHTVSPPVTPPAAVSAPVAPRRLSLRSVGAGIGPLMVQLPLALQEFSIGQRHRPAIDRKHRHVQLPMRFRQPTRANNGETNPFGGGM